MDHSTPEARPRVIPIAVDTGTAYGRPAPSYKRDLTEVGPGTPMGELLRRYWHPVGLSSHATSTPREVRVLGEDLVLFRDGGGRAGFGVRRAERDGAAQAGGARVCRPRG